MRSILLFLPLLALCVGSISAEKIAVERLFDSPALDGSAPVGLKFSPDGQRVTFLKGKENNHKILDLWEYHIPSGETRLLVDSTLLQSEPAEISDIEKARRERQRNSNRGIIQYFWSKDSRTLLFPLGGDIFHYRLEDVNAQRLTNTEEYETDPKLSPLGNYASFIREQNLFILHIETGVETQITTRGKGVISYGTAEFIAQEEMRRQTGYWWSPDESHIAFMRVDESPVNTITRSEIYAESIKMIDQRYPRAGADNAKVELGVIRAKKANPLERNRPLWISGSGNGYLPRVKWLPDSRRISHQWQSRDQKMLRLIVTNIEDDKQRAIVEETSETWINLPTDNQLHFLEGKDQFIWTSEKDGYNHIYLYGADGALIRQLTKGKWVVKQICAVDEKNGKVFFTANKETPLEQHLYSVDLHTPSEPIKITKRKGTHSIQFAQDAKTYIDRYSNATRPTQVSLHKANGEQIVFLDENKLDESHPLSSYQSDWIAPEFGRISNNGDADLYYRLYKPYNYKTNKQYPVIIYTYGGPGSQQVADKWSSPFLQYLAQQGYVVFTLDNRGSANRGTKFESAIYKQLGNIELQDQLAGVDFLKNLPFVDPDNIGIFGHSYGGYMTLMAMFKEGDTFKAGVSIAPPTDWRLYDTHYTEHYLGLPSENPEGYERSSVFPYVDGLEGSLLIVHGMADDNVLFSHSTKLLKTLQDKAIPFETMVYPGKKHGLRGKNTKIHLHHSIVRFFDRNLK